MFGVSCKSKYQAPVVSVPKFSSRVVTAGQMTKEQFLRLLEEGQLKFLSIIAQGGTRVRVYRSAAAAVTGRTMIEVQYMGAEMSIESRYTHVYAEEAGAWWLEIAQWTAIEQT